MKSSKGMTLIIVMAALLVTGFIGLALIKLSTADQLSSVYYSTSDKARSSATSGLIKGTSVLTSLDTAKVRAILEDWINTPNPNNISNNHIWLAGGPGANDFETMDKLQKYKVQIIGFDVKSKTIAMLSDGTGPGSRSRVMGIYKLSGFDMVSTEIPVDMNALYLGQGGGEIIGRLIIYGDTYVEQCRSKFISGEGEHTFYGLFRTAISQPTDTMLIKDCRFKEQTIIMSNFKDDGGPSYFEKGVGFGRSVNMGGQKIHITGGYGGIFNNGYKGGGNTTTTGPMLNNTTVLYKYGTTWSTAGVSATPATIAQGESGVESYSSDMSFIDMSTKLGITKGIPSALTIDLTGIGPIHEYKTLFGTKPITADQLNTAWANNTKYNNEYLVIHGTSSDGSGKTFLNTGTFTKKVIWNYDSKTQALQGNMFTMSNDASFLLYIKNSQFMNMNLGTQFRGIIFAEGYTGINKFGDLSTQHCFNSNNNIIKGAMIINDRIFRLQKGSGTFTIDYTNNMDAIKPFIDMNIFKIKGSTETSKPKFTYTQRNLNSSLLSRAF